MSHHQTQQRCHGNQTYHYVPNPQGIEIDNGGGKTDESQP
jgi:hypothetical protein